VFSPDLPLDNSNKTRLAGQKPEFYPRFSCITPEIPSKEALLSVFLRSGNLVGKKIGIFEKISCKSFFSMVSYTK
jgi:hypothetical protein